MKKKICYIYFHYNQYQSNIGNFIVASLQFFILPFTWFFKTKNNKSFKETALDLYKFKQTKPNTSSNAIFGKLLMILFFSLFLLVQVITGIHWIQYFIENIFLFLFFLAFNVILIEILEQELIFKKDQHLTYFSQFQKEPDLVKSKWAFISFLIMIFVLVLFFVCIWLLTVN